jgi:hypothetical protein
MLTNLIKYIVLNTQVFVPRDLDHWLKVIADGKEFGVQIKSDVNRNSSNNTNLGDMIEALGTAKTTDDLPNADVWFWCKLASGGKYNSVKLYAISVLGGVIKSAIDRLNRLFRKVAIAC